MKVTNKVTIHLDDLRLMRPVDVMQCDTHTRELEISLYAGNEAWVIPDGLTPVIGYRKPDCTKGLYDTLPDGTPACSISGNAVKAIIPPQALDVPGRVHLAVIFMDDDGNQLATFNVPIEVHRNPGVGAVASGDYFNLQKWVQEQIPTTLPNPQKLILTGAVKAEYDGSGEVKVEIPAGGGGSGEPGADGGYYTPVVTQEVSGTMSVAFTPSKEGMPAVPPVAVVLPQGEKGKDGQDGYTPQKGVDYFDGSNGQNGSPGKDGTSPVVSVAAIAGGHRITITDVNGTKTVDVMDGSSGQDGADGSPGQDGYTPVKGKDYFTDADKAELVAAVIESLGGNPVFGYVDADNNIIVSGNLADGTYTLKYEMEDGSTVDIGELVLSEAEPEEPEPTNFFVVGGDGYLNPGRASSSGADRTDLTTCLLSNYIEVQNGDEIYAYGACSSNENVGLSAIYQADKSGVGFYVRSNPTQLTNISMSDEVDVFTINYEGAAYIRVCCLIPSDLSTIKINIKRNGEWL